MSRAPDAERRVGRSGNAGSRWTDRFLMNRQARETRGEQVDLGRQPIYQELHLFPNTVPTPSRLPINQVGNSPMTSRHSGNPWAIDISAPSPNPGVDPASTQLLQRARQDSRPGVHLLDRPCGRPRPEGDHTCCPQGKAPHDGGWRPAHRLRRILPLAARTLAVVSLPKKNRCCRRGTMRSACPVVLLSLERRIYWFSRPCRFFLHRSGHR